MKSYGAKVILFSKEDGGFIRCIKEAQKYAKENNIEVTPLDVLIEKVLEKPEEFYKKISDLPINCIALPASKSIH